MRIGSTDQLHFFIAERLQHLFADTDILMTVAVMDAGIVFPIHVFFFQCIGDSEKDCWEYENAKSY